MLNETNVIIDTRVAIAGIAAHIKTVHPELTALCRNGVSLIDSVVFNDTDFTEPLVTMATGERIADIADIPDAHCQQYQYTRLHTLDRRMNELNKRKHDYQCIISDVSNLSEVCIDTIIDANNISWWHNSIWSELFGSVPPRTVRDALNLKMHPLLNIYHHHYNSADLKNAQLQSDIVQSDIRRTLLTKLFSETKAFSVPARSVADSFKDPDETWLTPTNNGGVAKMSITQQYDDVTIYFGEGYNITVVNTGDLPVTIPLVLLSSDMTIHTTLNIRGTEIEFKGSHLFNITYPNPTTIHMEYLLDGNLPNSFDKFRVVDITIEDAINMLYGYRNEIDANKKCLTDMMAELSEYEYKRADIVDDIIPVYKDTTLENSDAVYERLAVDILTAYIAQVNQEFLTDGNISNVTFSKYLTAYMGCSDIGLTIDAEFFNIVESDTEQSTSLTRNEVYRIKARGNVPSCTCDPATVSDYKALLVNGVRTLLCNVCASKQPGDAVPVASWKNREEIVNLFSPIRATLVNKLTSDSELEKLHRYAVGLPKTVTQRASLLDMIEEKIYDSRTTKLDWLWTSGNWDIKNVSSGILVTVEG